MPKRLAALLAVALSAACMGCATFDVPWWNRMPEASAKNPVVKIMCLWEPSEGRDPDGLPCRGFAGQLLFLGNKGGLPVKVHGDVTFYVFDDVGTPEQQGIPIHKFVFEKGTWDRHLKPGTFGASYHVFVPYMRRGMHEAMCAVRVKLAPPDGPPVYSDLCSIRLNGKPRDSAAGLQSPSPATVDAGADRQPRTTTIRVDTRPEDVPPLDSERVNRLLEDFLRRQAEQNPVGETPQQSGTERIRFNGKQVQVTPAEEPARTAHARSLEGQTTFIDQ
jgi:hypothetical protein